MSTGTLQQPPGNLFGTTTDNQGQDLPGVTVTLTSPGAPQVQVTNPEGHFRFLGLDPGSYQVKAQLEGFSPVVVPNITIAADRTTTITITMIPAIQD